MAPTPRRSPAINDVLVSSGGKRIEENIPLAKGFQFERKLSPQKEKKLESFFQVDKKAVESETPVTGPVSKKTAKPDERLSEPISRKAKKLLVIFISICLFAGSGVAAYLFIPRSKVIIYPRHKIQEMDLEITGDAARSEADMQSQTIPIKVTEKEKELTVSYQTTGKSASSLQKARGKVVIYNEYSNSSQPLVATTRLLSSDGKLFRLVKGVTVPGMTSVEGKAQPGAIEAEVIADESGESYNIGLSEFSIPGFEGGPKYEKFYARSTKPMTSGGSGGTATPIVSQQDIDEAKRKAETEIKAQLEEELKKDFPAGYILLPGALEQEIKDAAPAAKVGDLKDNFDYYIKVTARAIAFSEDDTKKIITGVFWQKSEENESVAPVAVQVEYGNISPDFSARIVKIKVHGKIILNPELNLEQLKKDLLGKNEEQIKDTLKNYPQIERIEVDFWPKFFPSRIPSYEKQTTVELRTLNL
ncbi:MAG: hypothetical protein NT136_01455 [Candidatus Moranbacteria bacterium]|nr:hypothetical protein [Candidatus Moranbacteria bacterium]